MAANVHPLPIYLHDIIKLIKNHYITSSLVKLVDTPRFAAEMKDDFHICEK
jgi:hypothetical protein